MKIDELNLSPRAYNCLRRAGIDTVEQLRRLPISELEKIRGMGGKSIKEIGNKLHDARFSEIDSLEVTRPELKHCPFCGGTAELVCVKNYGIGTYSFFVACVGCGVEMPRTSRTSKEAREAWNRRVGDDQMERMVENV